MAEPRLSSGATMAALQGFAIGTSLFSAGGMATMSLMGLPAILESARTSHTAAAKQFALVYRIGYVTQPPSTLLATLAFGWLAWRARDAGSPAWRPWAVAAASMGAVLPWTFGLMEPVSHGILRLAGVQSARESTIAAHMSAAQRTTHLLQRWNRLNAVRSAGPLVAGSVGLWLLLTY